jgi:predicted nucleic acid-binding protein
VVLHTLKATFAASHQFWPDDISITDDSAFEGALIAGTRQVTDVYLLGLAARRSGTMVSFDRSLAWQAVRSGSERLVQRPG